jgi:regulator of replication initiation timing
MPLPPVDMSNYITRIEFSSFEQRMDRNFALVMDAVLNKLAELKTDVSELKTDVSELKTDVSTLKTDVSTLKIEMTKLKIEMPAMEQRLTIELARHANAIQENVAVQISVIDEKYADMPGRMTALEQAQAQALPRTRASKPTRTRSR